MAFITSARTREIKKELTQKFPNLKFSVRNQNYSSVSVDIVAGDIDFSDILGGKEYCQINQYYIKEHYPTHGELLQSIFKIVNKDNYDNSDAMTDYFDVGFYVNFAIGQWDKPYQYKGAEVKV